MGACELAETILVDEEEQARLEIAYLGGGFTKNGERAIVRVIGSAGPAEKGQRTRFGNKRVWVPMSIDICQETLDLGACGNF
jgi:hypothetical protein